MFAIGQLKGNALAWFEPILSNFVNKENNTRQQRTKEIFSNFDNFEAYLVEGFRETDKVRKASNKIAKLIQKGFTLAYAATFRQLSAKTNWNNDAIIQMFYQGLKDEVKDELYKENRPDIFSKYAKMAVKIDNRLYKRRMEKSNCNNNFRGGRP